MSPRTPAPDHAPGSSSLVQNIAEQVKRLRREQHLTAAQLGEKVAAHGPPWDRFTVAALENGKRKNVTVDEVFALAYVFGVSPNALLLPREQRDSVALTSSVEVSAEEAWRWVTGDMPLASELPSRPEGELSLNEWAETYARPRKQIKDRFRAENRPYARVGDASRMMLGFNREYFALEQARRALLEAGAKAEDVEAYFEQAMEEHRMQPTAADAPTADD
jgi:transcriptional regulator with XRE-family HTH domain